MADGHRLPHRGATVPTGRAHEGTGVGQGGPTPPAGVAGGQVGRRGPRRAPSACRVELTVELGRQLLVAQVLVGHGVRSSVLVTGFDVGGHPPRSHRGARRGHRSGSPVMTSANAARPRAIRDRTVPIGTSRMSAISS